MKKLLLPLLLLISFSINAVAEQDKKRDLITVKTSDPSFTVTLPSNRTTGYAWFVVGYNPQLLKVAGQTYKAGDSHKRGAPGHTEFVFQLKDEAKHSNSISRLIFIYARPWQIEEGKSKQFTLVIHQ